MDHLRSLTSFNLIAALYPNIPTERRPFPTFYQPLIFALTLLPFLLPTHRQPIALAIFPLVLTLCYFAPYFTAGSAPADYYGSSPYIGMPLWFLDMAIITPRESPTSPAYIGRANKKAGAKEGKGDELTGKTASDCNSFMERLCWAFKLMIPSHRGIGWDWQVKNIPMNEAEKVSKRTFVKEHLGRALWCYCRSTALLTVIGATTASEGRYQYEVNSNRYIWAMCKLLDAMTGWAGAFWVCVRLSCFYSVVAALSVAAGFCEEWQWPPLFGNLADAWSVGRVWGKVYHQTMRRMVSKPASRISITLGLRKGSFISRTTQLFVSFYVSCLVHQYQMFNVTRRDMGEFAFFMSQSIAIRAEEFVQQAWARLSGRKQSGFPRAQWRKSIGYIWVVVWFSITLPLYVKGCLQSRVIEDVIFERRPFELGETIARVILR